MISVEIAPDVYRLSIGGFVNAYLVGNALGWVLVDSGVTGQFEGILDAAEQRFGVGSRPGALILTHGHGDHSGSALALATFWDVPIYAHTLELPYLTGKSDYPPADPTTGGPFAFAMRFAPFLMKRSDMGDVIQPLPHDGNVPGLSDDWRYIATSGHSPGHISLYRERDRVVIAGDAIATINVDSVRELVRPIHKVIGPPWPVTPDWYAARKSVDVLAKLSPAVLAPGHGEPLVGAEAATHLQRLAETFRVPVKGRYVPEPAEFDQHGVRYIPPAPTDPLPRLVGIVALVAVAGVGIWTVSRAKKVNASLS